MRTRRLAVLFATLLTSLTQVSATEGTDNKTTTIGHEIADFTLSDFRGKKTSLSDFHDAKIVVVVFLGTECPIVKLYAGRLQQLADRFQGDGVAIIGIDANQQDSLAELEHFARTHSIHFPLLKDPGNRIADLFRAQRTPEVFVLGAQRKIRYHGRIDDQYTYETQRSRKEQDYLTSAIEQLLAGSPVHIPETEVVGCHIGRLITESRDDGVTYADQISRILQQRCVECHRTGEIAPFALTDYDEVVGWAEMIEEVVREERMPPWHASPRHGSFANSRRLSDEEKQLIYKWIDDGAPKGDPADLPQPKQYVSGWQLPQRPDLVVPMRSEPFQVSSTGTIKYQYFVVDPKFTEDKWVNMAECLPGNRKVVHHILVFAQPPGGRPISGEQGGFLAAYVPGLRARSYGPGMAKRVRAGSRLIFQVHYTPIGTPQQDISSLGLVFLDPQQVKQEVRTVAAVQTKFAIPPGDANYRVEARSHRAPIEVELLAMMPHMHLRGKSFRYEARYPDGKTEILLDVPRYDFNWQTAYRLADAKPLPAGTRVQCVAHFDNSAENLANPDPTKTVRWGDQTWDEMMIGYMDIAIAVTTASKR
jgi:peroxiredoxin